MKTKLFLLPPLLFLLGACTNRTEGSVKNEAKGSSPYIQQLFVFQESDSPESCVSGHMPEEEFIRSGAMYLSKKGNIIYNMLDEKSDTQRYYFGKYQLTEGKLSYTLTDEFYYAGKWDAAWNVTEPDYTKGKTRKVNLAEVILTKSNCDSLLFFKNYSKEESTEAAKIYTYFKPQGISFWPYYETKEMKFYTWFYKQVPVLADL